MAPQLYVDRNGFEGTSIDRFITVNGRAGESANNGAGGGGAGGVVLLDVGTIVISALATNLDLIVEAIGGDGGNTNGGTDCTGPGGGGGVIWFRGTIPNSGVVTNVQGGNSGQGVGCSPSNHGAENGEDGAILEGLKYPVYYEENEEPI